jgi:hypothetical protein
MNDQEAAATVALGRIGEGQITFLQPVVMTDGSGYTRLPIVLKAPGLSAESALELQGWGGWTTSLVGFFDAMAAEWRGWDGVKEWSDDGDYRTDRIAATHDGLGTIEMRISTSPRLGWNGEEGNWTLELGHYRCWCARSHCVRNAPTSGRLGEHLSRHPADNHYVAVRTSSNA